jgi:hypothetical protein
MYRFFYSLRWSGAESTNTEATKWPNVPAPDDNCGGGGVEHSVEFLAEETEVLGENLPTSHIDMSRARTRTAAVGSRRLTAWATAWPVCSALLERKKGGVESELSNFVQRSCA